MKKIIFTIIMLFTFLSAASNYALQFEAGKNFYYSGNQDEALKIFQQIIKENPNDVDALLIRGNIFAQKAYYEIAIGDFMHVLILAPEYIDAHASMAKTYYWAGDYKNAKLKLNDWMSRQAENPDVYILAAKIEIASYNFIEARSYLDLAAKYGADPDEIEELVQTINMPKRETDWAVGTSFEYLFVNGGRPNWSQFRVFAQHDFKDAKVSAELSQYGRNDTFDNVLVVDAFFDVWEKAYMNTRLQLGLMREFMPRFDLTTELYQTIGTRWEGAVGYRMMDYDSAAAHIPSLAMAVYPGKFYIRDKISLIYIGSTNWQNQFTVRYFINELDNYVQLMSVIGTDFNVFNNEWIYSTAFALSGSWAINENYLITSVFSWTQDQYSTHRVGGSIGLTYRW